MRYRQSYQILVLLFSFLLLSCSDVEPTSSAPPLMVPTTAAPVPSEMSPEEALTLALECEGHLISNTIDYVVRGETPLGSETAAGALQAYEERGELPGGAVAFTATEANRVVWIYERDGRIVGKVAAEVAGDGTWVIGDIVRCAE